MNKSFKSFSRRVGAGVALVVASVPAFAIDISAATAEAKTDIATAGALIVGVVVAIAAIMWIRRVIK